MVQHLVPSQILCNLMETLESANEVSQEHQVAITNMLQFMKAFS